MSSHPAEPRPRSPAGGGFLSEERLAQATRLARLGFWVWDSIEDRCLDCSEEHARIHGLTVDGYIARSSKIDGEYALSHPEDRERYRACIRRLREHGEEFEIEYRVVLPNGRIRHVREVGQPVFDDQGRVIQEFGTSQDITETKVAEQQLRHSQKMEAVGQLTGGLAHDFNNLLAVVVGNLQLAQSQLGQASDLHRLLENAVAAAERGAALTRHLLAFSRKQTLRPSVLNVAQLVNGLYDLLHSTLGERVEIEIASDPELWFCEVDPGQLENAIVNLVLNARDAMPEGGVLVIATANRRLDRRALEETSVPGLGEVLASDSEGLEELEGDFVSITVSDTGEGMSAETKSRAFEPFFTTKGVGRGSGLGLSMVYGFVRQSGGAVALTSRERAGTSITLLLPRAQIEPATGGPQARSDEKSELGSGTVLVVEDERSLRELLAKMLESLGYRAVAAHDGASALERLEEGGIDLLLLDVVLPGDLDGPDLAERCRERVPGIAVVFMSGYTGSGIARERIESLGAELLHKPFKREELGRRLRHVLHA